jgi:hypothetical protein
MLEKEGDYLSQGQLGGVPISLRRIIAALDAPTAFSLDGPHVFGQEAQRRFYVSYGCLPQ